MASAKNLRELLLIREAERDYIDSISGNLGSALGVKNRNGDLCLIVFVEQKVDPKWLQASGGLIKKTLNGPRGLTCPTDVAQGRKYDIDSDVHLVDMSSESRSDYAPVVSRDDFLGPHHFKPRDRFYCWKWSEGGQLP